MLNNHVVRIQCSDQKGLIARISGVLYENNHNVLIMKEFVEEDSNTFFARIELSGELNIAKLHQELNVILPEDGVITVHPRQKKKILIMVTKEHHCLTDLLIRHHFKEINADIQAVIGTYEGLQEICTRMSIPFILIRHENKSREEFEAGLRDQIKEYDPDFIVLAKFMRILSPWFVSFYENRIINIHHSFLPAFVGAHPYKQAYDRGVKIIGATAHFVTNTLDDGPIISQKTIEVNHEYVLKDMIEAGHEIEKAVLADALKKVLHDQVFVVNNRTVILD